MLWSYEKPTKAGMYYVNLGDVVTQDSLFVNKFVLVGGELRGDNMFLLSEYHNSYKFMPVDYDYLNTIGNEG